MDGFSIYKLYQNCMDSLSEIDISRNLPEMKHDNKFENH
jgi:hypothetical protein